MEAELQKTFDDLVGLWVPYVTVGAGLYLLTGWLTRNSPSSLWHTFFGKIRYWVIGSAVFLFSLFLLFYTDWM